jgi:hypothetical protein
MAGLFSKKQTITNTETRLGSLRIQNSSQGLPIPIVFGLTRLTPNLIWYGDFTAIPHTDSQESGGKGGGGTTVTTTSYTYTTGVAMALCEGPSTSNTPVARAWSGKTKTDAATLGLTQFLGTYTQTAWSHLVTSHANEALGYRGTVYVAHAAFDLGSSDGLPNLSFEVQGSLAGNAVNCADALTELLTSDKYGAGWPSEALGDLSDWTSYCAQAGFLIAPAYTAQRPMTDITAALARIGNAAPLWSDGQLKVIPYADKQVGSYVPNLAVQYFLGYDDFIADPGTDPVQIDRKRQADAYNCVQVKCLDRNNEYNEAVVEAKDQLSIDFYGLRVMEPLEAHEICDLAVARSVAQAVLQRVLYVRNVFRFTLGWRYGRLEPMDIVAITDEKLNLFNQAVRITSVEEDENGHLAIEAEELKIGVSTPVTYGVQGGGGGYSPNNDTPPGNTSAPVIFQPPVAMAGSPQVWMGAAGGPDWGGCEVWVSSDNAAYTKLGTLSAPATYGVITANWPAGTDPDTTHNLPVDLTLSNGSLLSQSANVADGLGTLSYVEGANSAAGELIAFSAANLTAPYQYNLTTYIRRGQGGSAIASHVNGSDFMRLDDAVGKFPVPLSWMGHTIYVKLPAFNRTGGGLQDLSAVSAITYNVQTQPITGTGYSFLADRTSTNTTVDPGAGKMRFNNVAQASATEVAFDDLTVDGANMSNFFGALSGNGYLDIRDVSDSNKWVSYSLTSSNAGSGFHRFGVSFKASGTEIPNGDTVTASFSPLTPVGVTSVGLSMPSIFSVANSPITSNGTLAVTLNTQNAALFFASPASGNAAAPAFRAMQLTDIPPGSNNQVLTTSNGVTVWANASAGNGGGSSNLSLTINNQTANYTLALGDFNAPTQVDMNSSGNLVLTVPSNANVAVPTGGSVIFTRQGNGTVTISAQANVTVHNTSTNTLRAQYSPGALVKIGTDEWNLFGDLT